MKRGKIFTAVAIALASVLCAGTVTACSTEPEKFAEAEYTVKNGDTVTLASGNAEYKLLGNVPEGVSVSQDGTFSISSWVSDGTQVVLGALVDGKVVSTAVCTLSVETAKPQLSFGNLSSYIVDGERVEALSTPVYSVTYALKNKVDGINIDSVTGKVSYAGSVADGTEFVVTASSHGAVEEKTFKAAVSGLVSAENSVGISEYTKGCDLSFKLDFNGNSELEAAGVLGVACGTSRASSDDWSYDKATRTVTVNKSFTSSLSMGENTVKINTAKNTVSVTVKCANFITTAEEFAAIGESKEALSGYYVMLRDIDLTDYLADKPEGWKPIGEYHDVTDGTATDYAFAGTFDGNGHTLSGFYIDRADDYAYNSGVFGYVSNNGIISNLNVEVSKTKTYNARSYSGGFVGANCGIIENCSTDATLVMDEAFKTVGGFVGRNEGTITHSYCIGGASAGTEYGSFCGLNTGVISDCYSVSTISGLKFCGVGSAVICEQFESVEELQTADFSSWSGWITEEGKLPKLPSINVDYALRGIFITNTAKSVIRGDAVQITVKANPEDKLDLSGVNFEITEGDGVFVSASGLVNTRNAQTHRCTVKVSFGDFTAEYSFNIYEKTQSVEFSQKTATVRAGESYELNATVLPEGANPEIRYELVAPYQGASIEGNIFKTDKRTASGEIKVRAVSGDGQVSDEATITVTANEYADGCSLILYTDDNSPATFNLPSGKAQTVKRALINGKETQFTVDGNAIIIAKTAFAGLGRAEASVELITDETVYIGSVSVYDRSEVVEIATVKQFMAFKNDYTLFDKIIILTADLDFENAEITSVGSSATDKLFTGVFNGNGYTIKNLKITRNDFDEAEKNGNYDTYRYHSSYYNVGLFSLVEGAVRNVVFENVTVRPEFGGEVTGSFVGIVCGTLRGEVSGCDFINCVYGCAGEFKGIVAGKNEGQIISCFEK
ncbi:MAG: hypothetical protein K2O89_03235 [Clostridia bacterium]|nr:hypothetical protein [Clostridia bacterium]